MATVAVFYAVAAGILIAIAPQSSRSWRSLPDWIAAPAQLIAIASCATVVWARRHKRGRSLTLWALVAAFCVMSLVASYVWNVWRVLGKVPSLGFPDLCYLIDYGLLTAAYAAAFTRFGGSFRDPRTWLDGVTLLVALLGTFWGMLLASFLPPKHGPHIDLPYAIVYACSVATWMAMATLLYLRMPKMQAIPMLLIVAGLIDAIWEVGWLATWLTDRNYVGVYYNFGDVLCFTLIACSAAIIGPTAESEDRVESAERSAHAFVPTLVALIAIALVAATLASTRAPEAWILVGLVVLAALLLTTRQAAARGNLAELHRLLSVRAADARLTELVRQSADAFLVIDARGIVAYASSSTETTIGVSPSEAIGTSAATLFGEQHQATFERFLGRLMEDPVCTVTVELAIDLPKSQPRILRVKGANRLANVHIEGLTLTISDISEQHTLERDVLTAANHERLRLAGEIHDGLGQELSGIALMLQSLTKSPHIGVAQQQILSTIVGHITNAIRGARDLARGLSPIYVVRGSLREALRRLVRDVGSTPAVCVDVNPLFDHLIIDELPADHLFRIAREAVQNSIRHGSCSRIDVRLQLLEDNLLLMVTDDGVGYANQGATDRGFGLRLMEYRARVIGATFEIAPRAEGGTIMRVNVRLWNVARKRAIA